MHFVQSLISPDSRNGQVPGLRLGPPYSSLRLFKLLVPYNKINVTHVRVSYRYYEWQMYVHQAHTSEKRERQTGIEPATFRYALTIELTRLRWRAREQVRLMCYLFRHAPQYFPHKPLNILLNLIKYAIPGG